MPSLHLNNVIVVIIVQHCCQNNSAVPSNRNIVTGCLVSPCMKNKTSKMPSPDTLGNL